MRALLLALVLAAGCGARCHRHAHVHYDLTMLRLEPYEECARAAARFCQRTVAPANGCESLLIDEFCTQDVR